MGKSRAEIQRAYRQRKNEKEGESYLDRERNRIRKYYIPIVERSKKDQKARREKVRKFVKEHRIRKSLIEEQNLNSTSGIETDSDLRVESDENGVSSSTSAVKLIVKMPVFDPKQRTRKRVSRAVSKQRREIEKLTEENKNLQRKYKTVSKRYERLKKTKDSSTALPASKKDQSLRSSDQIDLNTQENHTNKEALTPRKRVANDLREAGMSPSKIPRKIQQDLLLTTVMTEEINDTRKRNGKKGRKVIANILTGKLMRKYKLQSLLNRYTGISRRTKESTTKKCDKVPKQEKQPSLRKQKKDKVIEFLQRDENSRMMPGKNDKVNVNKQYLQKRVLNDSMGFLHTKYKAETGEKISFSTFCRFRPKSISLTRYITKNQCLCQKHQNMALTLKCMRSYGTTTPLNPDEFMRQLEENNNMIDNLDESLPDIIHHDQWKKVTLDDGKKRTKVVGVDMEKEKFIKFVKDQIEEFKLHIFRVKQQYKALGNLKQFLPDGHIISQMDFAENFSCGTSDKVQSAYWNSNSITLHPVVIYFRENGELKNMNYVFVSDDLGHNIGSVYAIMKKLIADVKQSLNFEIKYVHYWTDGPSSQYRNKTAFYIVSNHQEVFGTGADWNYFETGHGKGACDGVGGTAKRMADLSIKQGKISIQEATDFYEWGRKYHKNAKYIMFAPDDCLAARKEVDEINKNICPVRGTLQIHHVSAVSKGKIRTMITSCYCEKCLESKFHTEYSECVLIKEIRSSKDKDKGIHPNRDLNTPDTEGSKEEESVAAERIANKTGALLNTDTWNTGDWVAAMYDTEWHIGQIREVDNKEHDCMVSFMRRDACRDDKTPSFKWPTPVDEIWVGFEKLLVPIKEPCKVGRSGRKYSIQKDEIDAIEDKIKLLH